MKNARQVCSCRDVGELKFAGMMAQLLLVSSNKSYCLDIWYSERLHKIALKLEDYLMQYK